MFVLTKIADLVQITPQDFRKPSIQAIQDNINAKYANKVIQTIGLCICLFDILWTSEGLIGHGDGGANINVEFRMIVFRPFKGETVLARIIGSTKEGISLSVDFFDDIFVPAEELPDGSTFVPNEAVWTWHEDDQTLYFDTNEMARVQVLAEEWHDQTPAGPVGGKGAEEVAEEEEEAVDLGEKRLNAPFRVIGSMRASGLGCCIWWDQ